VGIQNVLAAHEQYSLDPNIIDSDVFEGRENMEGINAQIAYGLRAM